MSNKILCLGDIHGRIIWKDIIEKESDADSIIFIGDYVDTYEKINAEAQLSNLIEIINFKRDNKGKVTLLIGNHDYHYLPDALRHGVSYSGFQGWKALDFKEQLSNAINNNFIQACKIIDNIIFSHAGVSKTWCKEHAIKINDNLEDSINHEFIHSPRLFDFITYFDGVYQYGSPYGDNIWQSPLWIRPKSLHEDRIEEYRHVAGHTQVDQIKEFDGIVLIDALEKGMYLIIEDDKFIPKQIDIPQ